MNYCLTALLLAVLINFVHLTCIPITFSKAKLAGYEVAYADSPRDNETNVPCNLGRSTNEITTDPGFYLQFDFFNVTNLAKEGAFIYVSDTDMLQMSFCSVTYDSQSIICPPSLTNATALRYSIRSVLTQNLPQFHITVQSLPGPSIIQSTASTSYETTSPSICKDLLTGEGSESCSGLKHLCFDPIFEPLMKKECCQTCGFL
uniref:ShKT domain-containing protein n=1 Tax=Rhabditophanes sp. KR3021 TaxID=114890 RepID=A0AC35UG08_9BILA